MSNYRTSLTCILVFVVVGCKPRQENNQSKLSDNAASQAKLVSVEYSHKGNPPEKLYLGILLPDETIEYLPGGMNRFTAIMSEILRTSKLNSRFLDQLQRDKDVDLEAGPEYWEVDSKGSRRQTFQFGRTDSSQMSRAQVMHYFNAKSASQIGIIPLALEKKGIEFDSFIWPYKEFEPKNIRAMRRHLKSSAAKDYFAPLLMIQDIEFEFLMREYEKVYNLSLFKLIRSEVKKDILYSEISGHLSRGTEAAVYTGVSLVFMGAGSILKSLTTLGSMSRLAKSGAGVTTALIAMLGSTYLRRRLQESRMSDEELQASIRKKISAQTYGDSHKFRFERRESAFKNLEVSWVKELVSFMSDPYIKSMLLDPRNDHLRFAELMQTAYSI